MQLNSPESNNPLKRTSSPSTDGPAAEPEFGPTLCVVTVFGSKLTYALTEFHFPQDVIPLDIPTHVIRHLENFRHLISDLIRKSLSLEHNPNISHDKVLYTLKTISPLAKKVYHQERWVGGLLFLLKKTEKGWVRLARSRKWLRQG